MVKGMDRDLLPWILGAALIATAAVAAAISWAGHPPSIAAVGIAPPPARAPSPPVSATWTAAPSTPQNDTTPLTSPTMPAPLHPAAAQPPLLAAGQVWECVEHGEKIFSDKRCGGDASIKQLEELNTMEAPAAPPAASYGAYPPAYGAYPPAYGAYPPAYGAYPPAYDQAYYLQPQPSAPQDSGDNFDDGSDGYIVGYAAARERWRRDHHRTRGEHARPPSATHGMAPARTAH